MSRKPFPLTLEVTRLTSIPSSNHGQQQQHQSMGVGPFERQLSQLDPTSDRVSTILVWERLTVLSREDKTTEFFRKVRSVMGPSGSGKSTLLNTLACRLDVNTITQGEMRLNGAPYNNAELKRIAGYVMQDDLLNGCLTVEETLMYTAELRLPRTFTNKQRRTRVEDVMIDMGLSHVRNVIIGTPMKKGISGGERKRLCVGMQLLNRPQLLFLDEPTSGLDSVTALDLLQTFHSLAHGKTQEKAVTIVCSIHQPQSKIFNLFDSLILLKEGNIIYQGPRNQAMETYRAAGFPCPLYTNPADHLLDVITPSKRDPSAKHKEAIVSPKQQAITDKAITAAQTPITIDLNMGAHKRLAQMANLPLNPIWHKRVLAYFTAKIIADTLVQIPVPIIFSCVVYFIVGLQPLPGKFFLFMLFMALCSLAATSLALMISALCKTANMSVTILPMALEVSRLFGGLFLSPANLPKYFSWLDALSYAKYTYVGVSLNELQGLTLSCADAGTRTCIPNGETTIKQLGLDYINNGGCIGALLAFIIFCRFIAYLGVRFLKN
ncbi:unnamed protein product [Adineta steineri]|uniref:ABC transporter domain-containing protein n=1 Tax=Adineta steineri TaxID=433720 RepID=A0A819A7R5_9BILA|nr:unnamed protein product [Adineta steineri]